MVQSCSWCTARMHNVTARHCHVHQVFTYTHRELHTMSDGAVDCRELAGEREPVDSGDCDPGVPGDSGAAVFPCDFFSTDLDIIG